MSANRHTPALSRKPLFQVLSRLWWPAGLALGASPLALASPQGGLVVGGAGSIAQPDVNTTLVNQTSSRLAIEWQSFNLAPADLVRFEQPSASAVVLNRILDENPSQIFGSIEANGQVFLANPNGVFFGPGARVEVGGLVVSGLDIASEDFMNGDLELRGEAGTGGLVVNRGLLQAATGGSVTLVGGAVVNHGVILADVGRVNLVSGSQVTLDFDGDGLVRFAVDEAVLENPGAAVAVDNTGEIRADGGQVLLSGQAAREVFDRAVNNEGVIRAGRIENRGGVIRLTGRGGDVVNSGVVAADGRGGDGGEVVLQSDADTLVTGQGRVSARSEDGRGGAVDLLGDRVGLTDEAGVDVSGAAGGGGVRIGGDLRGGGDTPTASRVYVGEQTQVRADGLASGDGGRIIVWSDEGTLVAGQLSARGGADSGDGGFVETSSAGGLSVFTTPDVASPTGIGGEWLIDPHNITIVADGDDLTPPIPVDPGPPSVPGDDNGPDFGGDLLDDVFNVISDDAQLGVGLLTSALTGGASVTISTGTTGTQPGNITLDTSLDYNGTGSNSLTLNAAGSIFINNTITDSSSGGDSLNLTLNAGNNVSIAAAVNVSGLTVDAGEAITDDLSGTVDVSGTSTLTAGAGGITLDNAGNDFGGTVTVTTSGNVTLRDSSGSLTVSTTGTVGALDLTTTAAGAGGIGLHGVSAASLNVTATGAITDMGTVTVTGISDLTAGAGGIDLDGAGNDFGGTVTVATAGNVTLVDGTGGLTVSTTGTVGTLDLTTTAGGIELDGVSAASLDVLALGAITDGANGTVTVTNDSNLITGAGGINLDSAGNDFGGTVTVATSGNVTLRDGSGSLTVSTTGTVGTLDLTTTAAGAGGIGLHGVSAASLDVTATGAITDMGTVTVTGISDLTAGAGGIDLDGAGNDFGGTVTVDTSGDVTLVDGTGGLTVSTTGAVGTLDLTTTAGGVGLDGVSAASLEVTATGAITDTDTVTVTNDSDLSAGAGGITLDDGSNDFGGTVFLNTTGSASIRNTGDLVLGASDVDGDLMVEVAGGSISQANPIADGSGLTVDGQSSFTVGNNRTITLSDPDNDFDANDTGPGAVSLTAPITGDVEIRDSDALVLGSVDAGSGVTVTATGISQTGASGITAGSADLDAGTGNITLENISNQIAGTIDLSGGVVSLSHDGAPTLGTLNNVTDLTLNIANGGITLPSLSLTSLDVTADGSIEQDAATTLEITGTSSFTTDGAGAQDIDLSNENNDFGGAVSLDTSAGSGDVMLTDMNSVMLGRVNLGTGMLRIYARNGDIDQDDILTQAANGGQVLFIAEGSGNVRLPRDNIITGAVSLITDGLARIHNVGDLTLGGTDAVHGAFNVGATLEVTTGNGSITQGNTPGDALTVTGTSSFTAGGGGSITLDNTDNDFGGAVSLNTTGAGDAHIVDSGNIVLATSSVGDQLDVTATGISQAAASTLTVGGMADLDGGTGSIVLDGANQFQSAVSLSADGDIELHNDVALTLGDVALANGTLDITTTNDNIDQAGGTTLTQTGGGIVTINAGSADVDLSNAGNDLQGTLNLTGNSVSLTNVSELSFGTLSTNNLTLDVTGGGVSLPTLNLTSLNVTARDEIGQVGTLTVSGTSSFTAGQQITLNNGGNNFDDAVSLNTTGAGSVQLTDTNALVLGSSDLGTGMLTITANGNITQSGAITQDPGAGAVNINAGGGNIDLSNAGNDFVGAVTLAGGASVAITDINELNLQQLQTAAGGTASVEADTLPNLNNISGADSLGLTVNGGGVNLPALNLVDLSVSANGAITQSDAVSVSGEADFDTQASGGDIDLTDTNNEFIEVGLNTGGNASVTDADALELRASQVGADLTVVTDGNITQNGILSVDGTASFDTGAGAHGITLTQNNLFNGSVRLMTVGDASVTDADALDLGVSDVDTLTVMAGGAITQSGALSVNGIVADFDAGGDITLNHANNAFTGLILTTTGSANIQDTGALELGPSEVGADLDVVTEGDIIQSGVLSVGGTASFSTTAGGAITLTGANTFDQVVSLNTTGNASASVTDADALELGTSTVGGALTVTAGGAITQSGVLSVGGTSGFDAGGSDITLTQANTFDQAVSLHTLGNASVTDADALELGASTVGGTLTVTAGGDITDSGTLSVTGISSFTTSAADGTITLDHINNAFTGAVSMAADGNVTLIEGVDDLTLGDLDIGGNFVVTADGDINQDSTIGDIRVQGTSLITTLGGMVDLDFDANNFIGEVTVNVGQQVVINDEDDLILETLNVGGTLTVTAGGSITQSGAVTVTGDSSFVANAVDGDITLDAANNFGGSVALVAGGDVLINDTGALDIGSALNESETIVGGTLTVTAGGAITDNGTLTVAGVTNLSADNGSADITLDSAGSTFGTLQLNGAAVSINEAADSDLGLSTVDTLILDSTGNITVVNTATAATNITLDADGNIGFAQAAGVTGLDSAGGVTLIAGGAVTGNANAATDVQATTLSVDTQTGIGATESLETQVDTLAARTDSGDMAIANTGALTIGTVDGIDGLSITDADNSDDGADILVLNASPLTVDQAIVNADGGAIELSALGDQLDDDITLNADLTVSGGPGSVGLTAGDSVVMNSGADITTAGGGIALQASTSDRSVLGSGNADGSVTMNLGSSLSSSDGVIGLAATADVTVADIDAGDGNILLQADADNVGGGAIDNAGGTVSGAILVATAGTGITLNTTVDNADLSVVGVGDIDIQETDDIALTDVDTADGAINIEAGGDLTASNVASGGNGAIALAGANVSVQDAGVNAGAGAVALEATSGTVTGQTVTGGALTVDATGGIDLGTAVDSADLSVSGVGTIQMAEADAIVLADVDTANGSITVEAGGLLTAEDVQSTVDSQANTITLTGADIVVDGVVNAGTAAGDVVLTGDTVTGQTVTGDVLTVDAVSGIDLETAVNSADLSVSGAGDIEVTEADTVELTDVDTANGGITVTAAGELTAVDVESTTDADGNDIALTGTDVVIDGTVNAGPTAGDVTLTATTGTVSGQTVTGDVLTVDAISGIDLETQVNSVDLSVSAAGDIEVTETDAVEMTDVDTADGSITVTANDQLTAVDVQSLTDADGNDIALTGTDVVINGIVNAGQTAGDVMLTAGTGTVTGQTVTGDVLTVDAISGIDLQTSVNSTDLSVSGVGAILMIEADAVELTDVDTANGSITVTAGGELTAVDVASTTDADGNEITLTGTDVVVNGTVNAGPTAGDVTLTAGTGTVTGQTVTGDVLTVDAISGIDLDTTVNSTNLSVSAAGDIEVTETDAVELTDVDTADGSITVTAGGELTALDVQSSTDVDGNDIALTGTDVVVNGTINAGSAAGDVTLTASTGTVTGQTVTGDVLTVDAISGIDLDTQVNSADLSVSAAGDIDVTEADAVELTDVDTVDGSITVTAGDPLTAVDVQSLTDADGNDIALTGTDVVVNGTVNAGSTAGDVALTASTGTVSGQTVTGDVLTVDAISGIDLDTTVNSMDLSVSAAGDIEVTETDAVELTDVDTADGSITVTAGDQLTALDVQSTTDADGNDIALTGTDVTVNGTVNAGPTAGDVTLTASTGTVSGQTVMADVLTVDAISGIDLDTQVNSADLSVSGAGDIEVTEADAVELTDMDTADGSITVTAGGELTALDVASATDADGNDIALTGTDVVVNGTVNAGPTAGDVTLTAATGTVTGQTVTGDVLTVDAISGIDLDTTVNSMDLSVSAAGDIEVTEADAVKLTDVDTADGSITVTAGDQLTALDVQSTTDADGNDIALTGTDVVVNGTVNAGPAAGDATLMATTGTVSGQTVTADVLTVDAVSGIDLDTAVNSADLSVSGAGTLTVDEADAVELTDVDTADGGITVTADGVLTALDVQSSTDADGNDITLTGTDVVVNGTVNAGPTAGDVTLTATTGTVSGQTVTADVLTVDAISGMDLGTAVNSADLSVSGSGDIQVTEADAIRLADVDTTDGDIQVDAGGDLTASQVDAAGSVALSANPGDLIIDNVSADLDLTLRAPVGGITHLGGLLSGRMLTVESQDGVDLRTAVDSSVIQITGNGAIALEEQDAIELTDLSTNDGGIQVTAGGELTATQVTAGDADGNDLHAVELTATTGDLIATAVTADDAANLVAEQGNIQVQTLEAGGDVNLETPQGGIDVIPPDSVLSGNGLTILSRDGVTLNTAVDSAAVEVTGDGSIELNEADDLEFQAGTQGGDILADAGGDLTLAEVSAGAGDVNLNSGGEVSGGVIDANRLQVDAASSVDIDTRVSQAQISAQSGGITLDEADDIELTDLQASRDIVVNAGDIDIDQVSTQGDATFDAQGSITGGSVDADGLTADADGNISLNTSVASADVNAGGDVELEETDGIELVDVSGSNVTVSAGAIQTQSVSADNTIDLSAAGAVSGMGINAPDLIVQAGSGIDLQTAVDTATLTIDAGNITLEEADDLTLVAVDAGAGELNLTIGGAVLDGGGTVGAGRMVATVGSGLTLNDTALDEVDLEVTGAGDVSLTEADAVQLTRVTTADGAITVNSGGAMDAVQVTANDAGGDQDHDVSLTAADGDLTAGDIAADRAVNLTATQGAILDQAGDVVAVDLQAQAQSGITLTTAVESASLAVTGGGAIDLNEADAIRLDQVSTSDGNIQISAGQDMDALVVSADGDHDLSLESRQGDLRVADLDAGATITLDAQQGGIASTADRVTGNALRAGAATGIDLDTQVSLLAAETDTGDLTIHNQGALTLDTVDGLSGVSIGDGVAGALGSIQITTQSPLTVADVVINHTTGDILLAAQGNQPEDDLTVQAAVTAHGGDIALHAGDGLVMDADVQVTAAGNGQVSLLAGSDYNGGAPQAGNGTGQVIMGSGSRVTSDGGDIILSGLGGVQLAEVNADADLDADAGNVTLVAEGGAVVQTEGRVTADNLDIESANGIFADRIDPTEENIFQTDVTSLGLTVTGQGAVNIQEQDGLLLNGAFLQDGDLFMQVLQGDLVLGQGLPGSGSVIEAPGANRVDLVVGVPNQATLDDGLIPGDFGYRLETGGQLRASDDRSFDGDSFHVQSGGDVNLVAFRQIGSQQAPISIDAPKGTLSVSDIGGQAFFDVLNGGAFPVLLGIGFNLNQAREAAQQETGVEEADFGFVDPAVFTLQFDLFDFLDPRLLLPEDQRLDFGDFEDFEDFEDQALYELDTPLDVAVSE